MHQAIMLLHVACNISSLLMQRCTLLHVPCA
jgi:hypothetical protein